MPDIFDRISKPKGDVFDRLSSNKTAGDVFDRIGPTEQKHGLAEQFVSAIPGGAVAMDVARGVLSENPVEYFGGALRRFPGNVAASALDINAALGQKVSDVVGAEKAALTKLESATGIPFISNQKIPVQQRIQENIVQPSRKQAEYVRREMGLEQSGAPERVAASLTTAPFGMAEFTLGPEFAGVTSAASEYMQSGDIGKSVLSGAKSAAEWAVMKKLLDVSSELRLPERATAMAAAGAAQAYANGGGEKEMLESAATFAGFAGMGGGKRTAKDIAKDFRESFAKKPKEEPAKIQERRTSDERRARYDAAIKAGDTEGAWRISQEDTLTGLPGQNLWRMDSKVASGQGQRVALGDAAGLKWFNDNLGYEAGDAYLATVGRVAKESGLKAYRAGGDEIGFIFESPEAAEAGLSELQNRMASAIIEFRTPTGELKQFKGARFDYGHGTEAKEADANLKSRRAADEAAGLRNTARGGRPFGLEELPAEGVEVGQDITAGRPGLSATVEELTSPERLASGGLPAQGTRTQDVTGANIERRLEAKYETTRQSKEAAKTVLENFRNEIFSGRRGGEKGVVPVKEDLKLAEKIGINLKEVMKANKGRAPLGVELRAVENAIVDSMNEINRLSAKVREGRAEDIEKMQLVAHVEEVVQLDRYLTGQLAEWGRAGRLLREAVESGKAQRHISNTLKGLQERGLSPEKIAEEMEGVTDIETAIKKIKGKHAPTLWDKYFEYVSNAMLTNPVTYVKNIIGNTLALALKPPTRAVAGGIDVLRSNLTDNPRQVFAKEGARQLAALDTGFKEGVRRMVEAWKDPERAYNDMKIEVQHSGGAISGKKGVYIRTPWRILGATDAFFKGVVETMETHALAHREAWKKSGGDPAKFAENLAEILQNPPDHIIEAAQKEARHRAFQDDLGSIGRAVMNLRNADLYGAKPLQLVLPFVKTPANLAKFTVKHTPAGVPIAALKYARALRGKGDMTYPEFAEEMAKAAVGSAIFSSIALYALDGNLTGGGPKDRNELAALRATGWQPYSIKLGDKYYSYQNIEPLGMMMGLAADTAEAVEYAQMDEKTASDVIGKVGLSVAKNLTDRTYMKGLANALDAMDDELAFQRWVGDTMTQPIPSGVGAVARITDPELKYSRELLDDIRERVPGLREQVQPRIDIWGNTMKYSGGPAERLFSPFWVSQDKHDTIGEELVRLQLYKGQVKREGRTPSEYTAYAKLAGKLARRNAEAVYNDPMYKSAPPEAQKKALSDAINRGRTEARARLK